MTAVSQNPEKYFADMREIIDSALDRRLPKPETLPGRLHESMRYSVMAGGKRIRPILCLAVSEGLGAPRENALKPACALEILHTYSLIHDDLPAMDNDDLRRGKPTNHKVYGEAIAILTGDALLTLAFEWLGDSATERLSPETAVRLIAVFSRAVGHSGMVGGQVLDMEGENRPLLTLDDLHRIHSRKTGALLRASVEMGAIIAGTIPLEFDLLGEFGERLGFLFQIIDDILDVEGDPGKLGKKTGGDQARGKATYPAILGLAPSKIFAKKMRDEALSLLSRLPRRLPVLEEITEFVYQRAM